jgi:hypothetical protein
MTAADTAKALRLMADLIEAGEIPLPSRSWPLVFHASDEHAARVIAAALPITAVQVFPDLSDDGWPWMQITGSAGGVPVRVTADAGAVVLDPLTGDGAIVRTYALDGAL